MRRHGLCTLAVAISVAFWGTLPATATTMIYKSVEDLVTTSDLVVHGTISGHRTFWQDGTILTDWQVDVVEVIAGELDQSELYFQQIGGEIDGYRLNIPGDARFYEGEGVVLLLRRVAGDRYYLTAMGQSKLSFDGAGASMLASTPGPRGDAGLLRDLRDIGFYDIERGGVYGGEQIERLTLDSLRRIAREARR